jgi:hypothetical protein
MRIERHCFLPRAKAGALLLLGLGMTACGGSEEQPSTPGPSVVEDPAVATAPAVAPSPPGLCAIVTAVDLEAAFDGQLTFGEARGDETYCALPLIDAEGEGLMVGTAGTVPIYEAKAAYADQGAPFRKVEGLGVDAFLINHAELLVRRADDSVTTVAVQAFFLDREAPPAEVVERGLLEVGRAVLAED